MSFPPPQATGLRTPDAEVDVDAALVRALLAEQHPDIADRPIDLVASGWDNTTFRLGGDLAVRLPRRSAAAHLIAHEQTFLPAFAARLPLPVPAPVRTGRPGCGYPWTWSVVPWFTGASVDVHPVRDDQAELLGGFLAALHTPAPVDAPVNPYRGVPLATRADRVVGRLDRLAQRGFPVAPLRDVWRRAVAAPVSTSSVWLHGDLHPRNLLARDGRLVAVIDWGDVTAGDPATDLAAAWLTWDTGVHDRFRAAYGRVDDTALWHRAAGWATAFALILLEVGLEDDPAFAAVGTRAVERLAGAAAPEVC